MFEARPVAECIKRREEIGKKRIKNEIIKPKKTKIDEPSKKLWTREKFASLPNHQEGYKFGQKKFFFYFDTKKKKCSFYCQRQAKWLLWISNANEQSNLKPQAILLKEDVTMKCKMRTFFCCCLNINKSQ